MAMSGRNDYHSKNIKKAAKNATAKTKVAAGAVQDAVREKIDAVNESAKQMFKAVSDAAKDSQEKSKAAGKDIKQGAHDVVKD
jgi:hypothetical protein